MNRSHGDAVESLPPKLRSLVVACCERFESEWQSASRPSVAHFLEPLDTDERSVVLRELVALEIELRSVDGSRPSMREYLERFPSDAPTVEAAFAPKGHDSASRTPSGEMRVSAASNGDETSSRATVKATIRSLSDAEHVGVQNSRDDLVPDRIGRYRVARLLGKGSFGRVFLAHDFELDRDVAIKVATAKSLALPGRIESLLEEGRLAAALKHPAIVDVYDVGRSEEGDVFIVLEYVEGETFCDELKRGAMKPDRLAEVIAQVADAVHHAHQTGFIHRDLKPSNIIVDRQGMPRVTDFGLALGETLQFERVGEIAGTPTHMSPEQVRGEVHRLDGRTDIWAIGVLLYEGLTQRRPFTGRNRATLFDEILSREPRPPRQIDDTIPRELERICLKCLSKRMVDRYETALDLAEDLQHWLNASSVTMTFAETAWPLVVPKGLRSFDARDADFFLSLLPGPRDRDGLPASIRFWKAWCEGNDGESTRAVGLLYGPSGSGKSSFVKAGLLPALDASVRIVYVEASRGQTEDRLLGSLRRAFPKLQAAADLPEAIVKLREATANSSDGQVLIVIDQFEQWLQAGAKDPNSELVRSLRHCDGIHLRTLVLVRDDFWMAVTRFFKLIEIPLAEGRNSAPAERFDETHARHILLEFGRACARVPARANQLHTETAAFVDQAVAALTDVDGGVAPVHLSLFFEVVRNRPWNPSTLREFGGIEGIGAKFLEDSLDAASMPPAYRVHRQAAEAVLRSLLPDSTSKLRAAPRPAKALQKAAGYDGRDGDFVELMRILDDELRIVTPADGAGNDGNATATSEELRYQLTHDYLVAPLRLWLTRKQRETKRGRAELQLAGLSSRWKDRRESRYLPSVLEWLEIVAFVPLWSWSTDERRMIHAATRYFAVRVGLVCVCIALIFFAARELRQRERAAALLSRIAQSELRQVPEVLPDLAARWDRLRPALLQAEQDANTSSSARDVVRLLLYRDRPSKKRSEALHAVLGTAGPREVAVIRDALAVHPSQAGIDGLEDVLAADSSDPAVRLRTACTLAKLDPTRVAGRKELADPLTRALLAEDRRTIPLWIDLLGPAADLLADPLLRTCRDASTDSPMLSAAAGALGEFFVHRGDERGLARAVIESRTEASTILARDLLRLERPDPALALLRDFAQADTVEAASAEEVSKAIPASWQANALAALAAAGEHELLWPQLRYDPDQRLRTLLIGRLGSSELDAEPIINRLAQPDLDPLERQALLLCFAEAPLGRLAPRATENVTEIARRLYRDDPHAAVHAAAELLLRRWAWTADLSDGEPPGSTNRAVRQHAPHWTTGQNGHVLVVLNGPLEFRMGSPEGEHGPIDNESLHVRRIDRSLAVATKEVTIEQFRKYRPDYYGGVTGDLEFPANFITWYDAAGYCNWLSRQAGLPVDQWCYPDNVGPGMVIAAAAVDRIGYRLPTEAEWEYLCRAGTETKRPHGEDDTLLPRYGWTWLNSDGKTRQVGRLLPNQFGVFDALGNVWEWCHDGPSTDSHERPSYPSGTREQPASDRMFDQLLREDYSWRFLRGGAFNYAPSAARSAHRDVYRAEISAAYVGFRVVRTLPRTGEERPSPTAVATPPNSRN